MLDSLSKDECDPVEIDAGGVSGDPRRVGGQKELFKSGRDLHRGLSCLAQVRRHDSPAEDEQPLFAGYPGDLCARSSRSRGVDREECHSRDITAPFRKRERYDRPKEFVGHLDQDPGAVAGLGIGTKGAAVGEVLERGEPEVDDLVGRGALQVGEERDATRVVFETRVVKA